MRDKPTCHWIIAGIAGAVLGAVLWFVLSGFIEDFGGEWLGRGGAPLASPYLLFAVLGTCIAVVMEVRRARRERRRAERLVAVAKELGLDYAFETAESDYSAWRELPVIQKWYEARNRLHGTVDDVPLEMLDYEYVVKASGESEIDGAHGAVGGQQDSYYDQTVVLLPAGEHELPSFLLLPRSFRTWLAGMVGQDGVWFSRAGISQNDAADIERFEKAYLLVANIETEPTTSAEADSGESGGGSPIHRLFSMRVIQLLADHPGWTVECHGRQLAFYRLRRIVPAAGRRRFLDEALALRAALVEPQDEASAVSPVADTSSTPEAASDRMIGTLIGAICGFFLGAILGLILAVWTLSHYSERDSNIVFAFILGAAPFFGGAFGGLILGALIGRWGLAGLVASTRRRRQERKRKVRMFVEHPNRWPGQPPESRATVEEDRDKLIVSLPPVGLVRAGGCGLFAFVAFWTVAIAVLTSVFLPIAFNWDPGEIQPGGYWGPTHPAGIAVVLIAAVWLVDILLLTILFYHGQLRTHLSISSDRLTIEHCTLFGVRRHELPADRITRLQAFHNEMIPDVFGNACLCIVSTGQMWPGLTLFRNRHHAEVAWLAKLINDRMTLPQLQP